MLSVRTWGRAIMLVLRWLGEKPGVILRRETNTPILAEAAETAARSPVLGEARVTEGG